MMTPPEFRICLDMLASVAVQPRQNARLPLLRGRRVNRLHDVCIY